MVSGLIVANFDIATTANFELYLSEPFAILKSILQKIQIDIDLVVQ